jgi:hypothetical protein
MRVFLAALTLVVLMGGVYLGVREVALHLADHLTITVTRSPYSTDGPTGSVVYQHVFGRDLTAKAENLLNDDTKPYTRPYGTLWGGHEWHYHLAFTWHGLLLETADVDTVTLPERYTISALGIPTPWPVTSVGDPILITLSQASGGSIPPPTA